MTFVDSAVHVWKKDPAYPWAEGITPPGKDATAEELLDMMDANGVDKTVIVQPICYKWDNSYVRDCIRRWPDRFAAVARVDPQDPDGYSKLRELTAQGFIGVRFGPVEREWWEGEALLATLKEAEALKVPVLLFLGKDGPKNLPWIVPVLHKVPDLTVVIDHMADADFTQSSQVELLLTLAFLDNIFIKVSHIWALSKEAYPWSDAMQLVKQLVGVFGPERLMVASDWPVCGMPSWPGGNTDYPTVIKLFKEELSFLSEDQREKLLGGTAHSIWFPKK